MLHSNTARCLPQFALVCTTALQDRNGREQKEPREQRPNSISLTLLTLLIQSHFLFSLLLLELCFFGLCFAVAQAS